MKLICIMRSLPLLLILWALSFPAVRAQTTINKDSIQGLIGKIKLSAIDTAHVHALSSLGLSLIEYDSTTSRQLLWEALGKSFMTKDQNTITDCYRLLGIWFSNFDYKEEALKYYRLSLTSATGNNNLYLMAGASLNIGNIKYWKGEYDSCIHYYLKAAAIFEDPDILRNTSITEKNLDRRKSDLYSNISGVFNTLKNLPKADLYIDKAIAIANKYHSPAAMDAKAYYMQKKADNYYENGNVERALRIRMAYLPQLEKGQISKADVQSAYLHIAQEFFELNKRDSAKVFAQKSLEAANQLNIRDDIVSTTMLLAKIAMAEGHYGLAESYAAEAEEYYLQSENPPERLGYYKFMQALKHAQGQYKEAYLFADKFIALNDSFLMGERAKQFSELEARYESERKETQINLQQAQLKQKNTLNYILFGGIAVLLVILLLSYRTYHQKKILQQRRINELETEKKLMATEAIIKGEEQERSRLAKDLHDGLGGMLSGIKHSLSSIRGNMIMTEQHMQTFSHSIVMIDSSISEMRRVAHNMMPESLLKFGLDMALKDFCQQVSTSGIMKVSYQSIGLTDQNIEQSLAITVYRIVQELLNNVIRHSSAKKALVQVTLEGSQLLVTVEDDGKGMDTNMLKSAKGIGWKNISSRLDYHNGKLDLQSSPDKGTSVYIEFMI